MFVSSSIYNFWTYEIAEVVFYYCFTLININYGKLVLDKSVIKICEFTVNYSKHFPETGINLPPSLSHSNAFLNCRKVQTSFNKNILFRSVRIPLQLIPWLKTQGHISKAPCGALIMAGHQVPTTPLSPPCPHRGRKCNGEAHGLR